jgi:hypothetical protein
MLLATFQAPGRSDVLAGAVRGDRVVAFADGSSVRDVLAAGGSASLAP